MGDFGDDWLRTNIFHTTCTVVNKVYKMIIDIGSCEKRPETVIEDRSLSQAIQTVVAQQGE
jgi:hypothetical protein